LICARSLEKSLERVHEYIGQEDWAEAIAALASQLHILAAELGIETLDELDVER